MNAVLAGTEGRGLPPTRPVAPDAWDRYDATATTPSAPRTAGLLEMDGPSGRVNFGVSCAGRQALGATILLSAGRHG